MSFCWLLPAAQRPAGALAFARLISLEGRDAGGLAAFQGGREPPGGDAVKVDVRAVDPDGPAGLISLVSASLVSASLVSATAGLWLPFDDVAVSAAIRAVLAGPPHDVVSTLSRSDHQFVGALTAVHGEELPAGRLRLADDPFARLMPRRLLRIDAGFLGRTPPPVGPSMQRYGAHTPWPWDRFS